MNYGDTSHIRENLIIPAFMFWHLHSASLIIGLILKSDIDLFSEIKSVGNI